MQANKAFNDELWQHMDMQAPPCLDLYLDVVDLDHPVRHAPTLRSSLAALARAYSEDAYSYVMLRAIHQSRFCYAGKEAKLDAPRPPPVFRLARRRPSRAMVDLMTNVQSVDDAEAVIAHLTEQHENVPCGVITGLMEIYCRRWPHRFARP